MVKSEGGEAEEIIDEENGILISTMLRQYFMGLRTVGQWKNLAENWVSVASTSAPLSPTATNKPVHSEWTKASAPSLNPALQASDEDTSKSWTDFLHSRLGLNKTPLNDDSDSESDSDSGGNGDPDAVGEDDMDFEVLLMRKFWTRWALRAGVKASVCDPLREGEMTVDWTRTIAPVLEGRIKMVQA